MEEEALFIKTIAYDDDDDDDGDLIARVQDVDTGFQSREG